MEIGHVNLTANKLPACFPICCLAKLTNDQYGSLSKALKRTSPHAGIGS